MSVYYSRYNLNTYSNTPYFRANLPKDYHLDLVLQKCRSFQKLPPHLQELSVLAKEWAQSNNALPKDIDNFYDNKGHELNPDTGELLTPEENAAQWHEPEQSAVKVEDIPVPSGGFPDPNGWSQEDTSDESGDVVDMEGVTATQVLENIKSRGREATAKEYGVPSRWLFRAKTDEDLARMVLGMHGKPRPASEDSAAPSVEPDAQPLTVKIYMGGGEVGTITQKGGGFHLDPKDSEILRRIIKNPIYIVVNGVSTQKVYAADNPPLFMHHLAGHYKSRQGLKASKVEGLSAAMAFDPSEPRDQTGEWTASGAQHAPESQPAQNQPQQSPEGKTPTRKAQAESVLAHLASQGVTLSEPHKKAVVNVFASSKKAQGHAVHNLPDGGKRASFYDPSEKGGKKQYNYEFDQSGKKTKFTKVTFTPTGKVYQIKYEEPPPPHWEPPNPDPSTYI